MQSSLPLGVRVLAVVYGVLGIVLVGATLYPCAAWQTATVEIAACTCSTTLLRGMMPVLGIAMVVVAAGLLQGKRMALHTALGGLALAVVLDLFSRRLALAGVDLVQLGYLFAVRDCLDG